MAPDIIMADIDYLREKFLKEIQAASDLAQLNEIKVFALGKKGAISAELGKLGQMEADKRKEAGQLINSIKQELLSSLSEKQLQLARKKK